jgi:hypothetical protein
MSKERYDEVIDIAYENFRVKVKDEYCPVYRTKEEFIDTVKNYPEFSKKWGLQIGERELEYYERRRYRAKLVREGLIPFGNGMIDDDFKHLDDNNIPTKEITITYNNEIIKYYE